MIRLNFISFGLVSILLSSILSAADPPNIVLIMADDLGVEGIECYGGKSYKTPSIDRLAAQGVRFTNAFAQPLCTNTRVQLMTGLYNNRNWLYFGTLDPKAKTIGHYMQEAGYSTCIAGKWQLQSYDPPSYPGSHLRRGKGMKVTEAGFDEYSLFHSWHTEDKGSRYADPTLYENGKLRQLDGEYGPDHWVKFINSFIKRKKDADRPFFVYYAMALPHRPFVPTPNSDQWRDEKKRSMEDIDHFPGMVEYMDQCVGRVVKQIDDLGLANNTVVIFYSDNGTHQKVVSKTEQGSVRGGKGRTTDAGTHVPLIVRWTGKIKTGVNENLVDSTDFLPTVREIASSPISETKQLDGISFYPQLLGQKTNVRPWVFCHYDPRPGWDKDQFRKLRFIRDKKYKLYGDGRLFDIPRDKLEKDPIRPADDTEETRQVRERLSNVLAGMPNPDPAPRDGNPENTEHRLYLAAAGSLSSFKVDKRTGKLERLQQLGLPGAGPFTFSPNKKWMYAVATKANGKKRSPSIASLKIKPDGKLELVENSVVGLRPGYLMSDNNGEFLAGSHYGAGKATIWRIEPIFKGLEVQQIALEPKAHSAVYSPDNRWLLVPATGPNKVFINHFTAQVGTVEPNNPPFVMGPSGKNDAQQPRHLIFHPNLSIAYTTNERMMPGVGVWQWDTEAGKLRAIQNIVTQPQGFSGSITTADLHLTPDARFLFVSNRDTSNRDSTQGRDSLVAFSVNPQSGRLTQIGHFPCERIPRSFSVGQSGRFLYVAGQGDGRLGVYRIKGSGALEKIEQYEVGKNPIWVRTHSLVN